MRENYADRLEILQPVLENESVYDGFKVNADYYIYDKLSEDEVVENYMKQFTDIGKQYSVIA